MTATPSLSVSEPESGTLRTPAVGDESDSIYFEPAIEGHTWGGIQASNFQQVSLQYCVFKGGGYYEEGLTDTVHSEIYDCRIAHAEIGLDFVTAYVPKVKRCVIERCIYYGIRGTASSGGFEDNIIRDCGLVGIYWIGDEYHWGSGAA
jgi:hypothetical protein